jgi:hypothetical protein
MHELHRAHSRTNEGLNSFMSLDYDVVGIGIRLRPASHIRGGGALGLVHGHRHAGANEASRTVACRN